MDTWINQKVDALLESEWGYPESKYEIPNGNMVYVYKTSETKVHHTMSPGISRSYVHSSHSYTVNYWCHTFFEVNKDNMIVKWKSDGNRCKAYAKENMAQKKL